LGYLAHTVITEMTYNVLSELMWDRRTSVNDVCLSMQDAAGVACRLCRC